MIQYLQQIYLKLKQLDLEITDRNLAVLRPHHVAEVIGTTDAMATIILEAGVRFNQFETQYNVWAPGKSRIIESYRFKHEIPETLINDESEKTELDGPFKVSPSLIEKVYVPKTR